jgi:hypothetical protein
MRSYEATPPADVITASKGKGKTKKDQTGPNLEEVAAPTDTTDSVRNHKLIRHHTLCDCRLALGCDLVSKQFSQYVRNLKTPFLKNKRGNGAYLNIRFVF